METIKTIEDYKAFIELNREKVYKNAIKADDISADDEWMQEDRWDELYNLQ